MVRRILEVQGNEAAEIGSRRSMRGDLEGDLGGFDLACPVGYVVVLGGAEIFAQ